MTTAPRRPRKAEMTAAALRDLLEAAGLSRVEFAERMGITRQTVWMWATGRTPISRQAVALISATLKAVK